jgi:LysM repeat protein
MLRFEVPSVLFAWRNISLTGLLQHTMSTHTIRRGDTLTKLATQFGTTVQALAKANKIADPNKITAGKKLVIPGKSDGFQSGPARKPNGPSEKRQASGDVFTQSGEGKPNVERRQAGQTPVTSMKDSNGRSYPTSADGTPMYKQGDKQWGKDTLGNSASIHAKGCAMTSTAMAISKISGKAINPQQLDAYLDKHGGYTGDNLNWPVAAKAAGLGAKNEKWSLGEINKQVDAGRPVVVGVDYKGTAKEDHWVTITGRERDANGKTTYLANDPATGKSFKFREEGGKLVSDYKASNGRPYGTTGRLITFQGGSPAANPPRVAGQASNPVGTGATLGASAAAAGAGAASTGGVQTSSTKPTTSGDWRKDAANIHQALGVNGNSRELSRAQIDKAIDMAAKQYGVPAEALQHIAASESNYNQKAANGKYGQGLMQVESVHTKAFEGAQNAGNDTISNIVYAAKLRSQSAQAITGAFEKAGMKPPTGKTLAVLSDFVYNRGNGAAAVIASHAKKQGIDPNNIQEYFAGKGGSASISDKNARLSMTPGKGVDMHGTGSVLQNAVAELGNPKGFSTKNKVDRSGDGKVDHFDIWLQRAKTML